MTERLITIDHRFRGPDNSGNGGYVCGRLAEYLPGPAVVRLSMPPPLSTPMEIRDVATGVELRAGGELIASSWLDDFSIQLPDPPTAAEVADSWPSFVGLRKHPFPECFVCGPEREEGDGLRIFPGQVRGKEIVAGPWVPHEGLCDESGVVAPRFVWSALDCPGGFSFQPDPGNAPVLGQFAARQLAPIELGQDYSVIGWEILRKGRKHQTGSAIFDTQGACVGKAQGTWIEVPLPT
jgi:hypothetical protein